MALQVDFSIIETIDSLGFVFIETTGPESASNPNGWGGGNTAWDTSYYAQISIKDSNGNQVGALDTEFPFTDFDSDPTSTQWPSPRMSINGSSYSVSLFTDGVYQITYTALDSEGGTVLSTKEHYFLFASGSQVNLKEAELKLPTCSEEGKVDASVVLSNYRALLVACQQMVDSSTYSVAQELVTTIYENTLNLCIVC